MTNLPVNRPSASSLFGGRLTRLNNKEIEIDYSFLVKGVLKPGDVSMIFGPSNVGKSTIVATLCTHLVKGEPFGKMATTKSLVVYVAAEDPKGVEDRAIPKLQNASKDAASFYVYPRAIDLLDDDATTGFATHLKALMIAESAATALVVFDTMAMSIGEGDENSARDMMRMIHNMRKIADTSGANALLVHHTNVSDTSRPRGSGAVFNAFDTVLLVADASKQHGKGVVSLQATKQRNGSKDRKIFFKLEPIQVDVDSDGEAITLPSAVYFEPPRLPMSVEPTTPQPGDELVLREKTVLRLTQRLGIGKPVNASVIFADFVAEFPTDKKRPSVLKEINRIFQRLADTGMVQGDGKTGYQLISQKAAPVS